MRTHALKGFNDLASRAAIVKQYLSQYLKELDEREIETIISLEGASNPLYLKILLSGRIPEREIVRQADVLRRYLLRCADRETAPHLAEMLRKISG